MDIRHFQFLSCSFDALMEHPVGHARPKCTHDDTAVAGISPSSPENLGGCKLGHQIWFGMEKGIGSKLGPLPLVGKIFVFHSCPTT